MEKLIFRVRVLTAWALFVVLVLATLALGGNRPVSWTLMSLAVMALFTFTLLLDLLQRRPPVFNRLWLPALLFLGALAWGAVQTLPGITPAAWAHPVWSLMPDSAPRVSADPANGIHMLMRLAAYGMIFWMALRAHEDKDAALNAIRAFALFAMGLSAYGIYADATGSNPILGALTTSNVSASFVNRNNFATFAGFGLVAALALLFRAASRGQERRRNAFAGFLHGVLSGGWLWIAGITLCGGALMLSLSRGGAAAALVGVLVVLSTQRLRGGLAVVGPTLIVAGVVGAIFVSASTGTIQRIVDTDEEGRFIVFPAMVEAIADRPLLGQGIGSFHSAFRAYVPPEAASGEWDMAHNSYLENAFELGLPAAAAFYLALALIGLRLLRGVIARKRNRTVVTVALAVFFLGAFHALFDFSLQMPALAGFFAWLLGIGYAQSFPRPDMKDRPR